MRKRALVAGGIVVVVVAFSVGVLTSCASFGKHPEGERLARIERSPEWIDGRFRNPEGMLRDYWQAIKNGLSGADESAPSTPVPHIDSRGEAFKTPPATGLRVTWFGHSSSLVEIDGVRVLTDPIWSDRASPVQWAGPERWYEPVIPLDALGAIDVVVISHDHYDHLDRATVSAIKDALFIVPLGIGAHLVYWGIPEERVVELDWWQSRKVGNVEITATPARHASGRLNPDGGQTLWAGYAMIGDAHRVYYSGDTGYFSALRDIGERLGPFDLTMIESGQYNVAWPDWHLGPEQAVAAHRLVRGKKMLPVHWALFKLAPHTWTEPVERVLEAARCSNVPVMTPRPGESFEPDTASSFQQWWPRNAWQSGREAPVIATRNGDAAQRFDIDDGCHPVDPTATQ